MKRVSPQIDDNVIMTINVSIGVSIAMNSNRILLTNPKLNAPSENLNVFRFLIKS